MSGDIVDTLATMCSDLTEALAMANSDEDRKSVVFAHINKIVKEPMKIDDFKKDLEWFNIQEQLSLDNQLLGKVVVLDFFTYCCVNCMHIIPDLKLLENKHSVQDGLVVVGVHSAKFDNEKDSDNIFAALQRYEISHPVVNDAEGVMWSQLGIPCWPTLLILGPKSEPLFIIMGEGKREDLFLYVESALEYFKLEDKLMNHQLPAAPLSRITKPNGPLSFPGKVACCLINEDETERERIAIADSGHHRIVIVTATGQIEFIIGGTNSGFVDGSYSEARFHSPQGLVFLTPYLLYVADTENHAIRLINLKELIVSSVAGTGFQSTDHVGGAKGTNQGISSPWDIALMSSSVLKGNAVDLKKNADVLLIAMAGLHQIWALFLQDCQWWKGKNYDAGTCVAIVGSGKEENRNNSYPQSAAFAQPSGLSITPNLPILYVADSESSSVRRVCLLSGKVSAVVGGDRSPTNLFSYGDTDGKQFDAKLQHPLAVASLSEDVLYVADSYNHKIKLVLAKTNECVTLLGSGKPGQGIGHFTTPSNVQLSEPGGLCASCDGKRLYIADTNNHCIRVVHLEEKLLSSLTIQPRTETDSTMPVDKCDTVLISEAGGEINLNFNITLHKGLHLTEEAPQKWTLLLPGTSWAASKTRGAYEPTVTIKVSVPASKPNISEDLSFCIRVYFCRGDECFVRNVHLVTTVVYDANAANKVDCHFNHEIKLQK